MAKKFVRNITGAKLKGANKEHLFTNVQNDILSDETDAYIRNGNEYFPLTRSITDIKSSDNSFKITRKGSSVTIQNLGSAGGKDLSTPKTITVKKPIIKEESEDNITLSLDPTIANLKNPKAINATSPIIKEETDENITLSLDPSIANLKAPKAINTTSPIVKKEDEDNITFSLKPLSDQIEVSGGLKKEVTDEGVKLYTEEVEEIKNPYLVKKFSEVLTDTLKKEKMEDDLDNWHQIPAGYYFAIPNQIENQPSDYGIFRVITRPGEFSIIWEKMAYGSIYRKSGNRNKMSDWVEISFDESKLPKEKELKVESPLQKQEQEGVIKISIDPKAFESTNGGIQEREINVISPLEKEESDEGITLSLKELPNLKELGVTSPLKLADNEDRQVVYLDKDFIEKVNKEVPQNKFSYPLIDDDGVISLDENFKNGLTNANIKVETPLKIDTTDGEVTIKIDNLDAIISKGIEDYLSQNPIEGKDYTFNFPLTVSDDNTVGLSPAWKSRIEKGIVNSVVSLDPISSSFSNNKLSVNTSSSFDLEYKQLKEDNAKLKTDNENLSKKVDDLNRLTTSLAKNVLALQKKLGV